MKLDNYSESIEVIGNRLMRLRVKKGFLTAKSFAQAYNLPVKQYEDLESGDRNMTLKALFRVLTIHSISLDEFLCVEVDKAAA